MPRGNATLAVARATGFKAPKTWPKELKKKWTVPVGEGVATPALVGERLYVFTRQDGQEIIRCLRAADGEEVWKDSYKVATGKWRATRSARARPTPTRSCRAIGCS